MAIIKKKPRDKMTIDLTGPQGNAYFILGTADQLGRQLGLDSDDLNAIMEDMKSSDYEHLIETFDKHFGSLVDLER